MRTWVLGTAAVVGLAGLLPGATPVRGADWPTFGRDRSRNAVSPEKGAPLAWQVERRENGFLTQPAWNVRWEAELGSGNFAAPVVAGGLVWVGTNNNRPRDPRVKGDAAVLMCFRESTGQFLWQYVSPRLDNHHQDWPSAGLCNALSFRPQVRPLWPGHTPSQP
jgi:hypothetical protein